MPDVRIVEVDQPVPVLVLFDWLMTPFGTLDQTNELATAVIVALATDALADPDDELPGLPPEDDRRGWWADVDAEAIWDGWPIGSKLWLLERTKITDAFSRRGDTVVVAEQYTRRALQPFLDKRIASLIDVTASRGVENYSRIDVQVTIYRGPFPAISLRFDSLWDEIANPPPPALLAPPALITYSTWDLGFLAAGMTLTPDKMTVTNVSGGGTATRSSRARSTGKFYCEFTINTSHGTDSVAVGICNASQLTTQDMSTTLNALSFYSGGGVWINSAGIAAIIGFTTGDIVSMAVDFDNEKIWFRVRGGFWNNINTADPMTNTGGISFASLNNGPYFAAVDLRTSLDKITANFGASPFSYNLPIGFSKFF